MSLSQRSVCDCNKRILYCIVIVQVCGVSSDPPSRPGRPDVVDYDADVAEIHWTPSSHDGGSPIQKYVIEQRQIPDHSWHSVRYTTRANSQRHYSCERKLYERKYGWKIIVCCASSSELIRHYWGYIYLFFIWRLYIILFISSVKQLVHWGE